MATFPPMTGEVRPEIAACFASPDQLDLSSERIQEQNRAFAHNSGPYNHSVIRPLIDDALLRAAREEIVEELRFADKETDIYKVNQTGDLANLDGLPDSEKDRLKALLKVRNAIYSKEFRNAIQTITGCGPLSEGKKDMSINDYRDGCHLLNHDDVISTRRVSFILYLPDPEQPWKPEYGGALELYPVSVAHEPEAVPTVSLPPMWNQIAFFPVIPGYSFHSVQEVVHPRASRISIQGWFHRPGPDEEGFSQEVEEKEEASRKAYSSADSLVGKKGSRSFVPYPDAAQAEQENGPAEAVDMTSSVVPGAALSKDDRTFLSFFLNPAYLNPAVQAKLFEQFGDESTILLAEFLKQEMADVLQDGLVNLDRRDHFRWFENKNEENMTGQELRDGCTIQPHAIGTGPASGTEDQWVLEGPPHHHRFLSLIDGYGKASVPSTLLGQNPPLPTQVPATAEAVLSLLRSTLLPSPAFRAFLANVTQLIPLAARYPFWARRFRPGLDYTLAKKDQDEAVLQVNLGLTPSVADSLVSSTTSKTTDGQPTMKRAKIESASPLSEEEIKALRLKWASGDAGGWECYMAPADEPDDPAVYGSGSKKDATEPEVEGQDEEGKGKAPEGEEEEEEVPVEIEEYNPEEDDDGVLLNLTPQFNALNVVLRDEGVMHFVKYLSASAGGSRWDVEGEWRVGAIDVDQEGENEDPKEAH